MAESNPGLRGEKEYIDCLANVLLASYHTLGDTELGFRNGVSD